MSRPDTPGVIAPPPLIVAAAIGAGMLLERSLPMSGAVSLPAAHRSVGGIVILVGLMICVWALVEFVRHKTSPEPWHPTKRIIGTGPFRFSRNPIYVGFLVAHAGFAIRSGSIWLVLTMLPAFLILKHGVVLREETYLSAKFGDDYADYRKRVRRWL